MVGVDDGDDVMIPVEENQLLLPEHDEDSIAELEGLAVDVEPHPESDPAFEHRPDVAYGAVPSFVGNLLKDLGCGVHSSRNCENGEARRPDSHGVSEGILGTRFHPRLDSEDDHEIDDGEDNRDPPVIDEPVILLFGVERVFGSLQIIREDHGFFLHRTQ